MRRLEDSPLVRSTGARWEEATTARFLDAVADGSLPTERPEVRQAYRYAMQCELDFFSAPLEAQP